MKYCVELIFLFCSVFFVVYANQSVWDFPETDLSGVSNVAIYRGSFDPLHKGHEAIVEECMKNGVSHVFLFPAFGLGEKDRSPLNFRTEMLKAFANGTSVQVFEFDIDPEMESDIATLKQVRSQIVSWMIALQNRGVKVYKVLGGDAAYKEVEALQHKPPNVVDGYILASRSGYPITPQLLEQFADLGIEAFPIDPPFQYLSSTWLRKELKNGCDVSMFISESTMDVIRKYRLYQDEN